MFFFMALPSGSVGAQRQNCANRLPGEEYLLRARRAAAQSPHQPLRLEPLWRPPARKAAKCGTRKPPTAPRSYILAAPN